MFGLPTTLVGSPATPTQKNKVIFVHFLGFIKLSFFKRHHNHQPPAIIVRPKNQTSMELSQLLENIENFFTTSQNMVEREKKYNPNFSYHSSALPFIRHKSRLSSPDP